jgi:hypothetical protein
MIRIVSATAFLFFAGVIIGGCSDIYTAPSPSHAVSADIAASHVGSSAPLSRTQTPDFRDMDLSGR